jgi:hypothetical protein
MSLKKVSAELVESRTQKNRGYPDPFELESIDTDQWYEMVDWQVHYSNPDSAQVSLRTRAKPVFPGYIARFRVDNIHDRIAYYGVFSQ